jgi:tetratricopeptide (TPR) repeat protein
VIDNIKAFFMLYVNPAAAFGRILDRGRVWFAALAAVGVGFVLHFGDIPLREPMSPLLRFISFAPGSYLIPPLLVAILIVPTIILMRSITGFGSFSVLLNNDYVPLLMCALMAWAAAYLPLTLLRFFALDLVDTPLVYAAFNGLAAILTAFAVRTVYGTGFGAAIGITLVAWAVGAAGAFVIAVVGGALYFLASPLVLIYLWLAFGSRLGSLGETMRSRQHFQQQLEISTANPHDADAHYQLGLIHQRRRQFSEATARFERAVKIDPSMADAHMQLGVIAREQGRFEDAIGHLKTAIALDDKLAQSDVWRELGAAYFGAGRFEEARAALEKFTSRREYDPEGLYWYGKTLKQLGQTAQAKEMFERAIEAVRTMPSHRRAQVRGWATRAKSEL